MINAQTVLQVWIHMPTNFTRRLGVLSKGNNPWHSAFLKQLERAKSLGIDAVIVPISWRMVEPYGPNCAAQKSSWASYREIFNTCINYGLKVIPEFHSAATGLKEKNQ